MTTFEEWAHDVDALCVKHLSCTWADLAGDREPPERSFAAGETPMQFVQWWAEKYGLVWMGVDALAVSLRSKGDQVPSDS